MSTFRTILGALFACIALAQCTNADTSAVDDASTGGDGASGACVPGLDKSCPKPVIKVLDSDGAISTGAVRHVSAAAGQMDLELKVVNAGDAPLLIKSVKLDYIAPGPESKPAFTCMGGDGVMPCAQLNWPDVAPGTGSVQFTVRYTPPGDGIERTARLHIVTNTPGTATDFLVNFTNAPGLPKLVVQPTADLGVVTAPATSLQVVAIQNQGAGPLMVSAIDASALSKAFSLTIAGVEYAAGALITLMPPLTIQPGQEVDVNLAYKAADDLPHAGDLILHTNDPSLTAEGGVGWKRIHVTVNQHGACVKVIPSEIIFGGAKVGNAVQQLLVLKSCGPVDAHVTSLGFAPPGGGAFAIDQPTLPLTITANAQTTVNVTYTPVAAAKSDASGSPILDTAALTLQFAEPDVAATTLQCSGFGVP